MAKILYCMFIIAVLVVATEGWLWKPKCYRLYGENTCFSVSKPFTNSAKKRPESPASQRISFSLYTPKNPTRAWRLSGSDPASITSSTLDAAKIIRVIIHGFRDRGTKPWVRSMTGELLTNDGSNVIVVDWEKGAAKSFFNYKQAVANTRVVGALLARMIEIISSKKKVALSRFHLIGHSLGAHIAGYAGRRLAGKIGRISGLDPAGPSFEKEDTRVRLDKSDAMFVDVIHTNGKPLAKGGFGISRECGDADFYPNGGQHQPGCSRKFADHIKALFGKGPKGFAASVSCDHLWVLGFYTESINSKCSFRACRGTVCSRMGFHASSSKRGRFNLRTKSPPKFC